MEELEEMDSAYSLIVSTLRITDTALERLFAVLIFSS